jgi:GT2 family glycosyltransferase
MNLRTAVIIATRGRPQEVSNLLNTLALQTHLPDVIVVSACDRNDIEESIVGAKNVEVLFGPPGLPAQRNRALSLVRGKYDIIMFFDDDFIPSRFWIEHLQSLFATQSDLVCVTGHVLIDGITVGALEWSNGQAVVNSADSSRKMLALKDCNMRDDPLPYGCNMAFRAKSIEHLTFDERLVQYGWLEDRDFAFRVGTEGRMIWTDALWGVHLGIKRGRDSGRRIGYSQVVNPWYLMIKGSIRPSDACRLIFRGLAGNAMPRFAKSSHIDRWGRLQGNVIGIKDIMVGRWGPERVAEL